MFAGWPARSRSSASATHLRPCTARPSDSMRSRSPSSAGRTRSGSCSRPCCSAAMRAGAALDADPGRHPGRDRRCPAGPDPAVPRGGDRHPAALADPRGPRRRPRSSATVTQLLREALGPDGRTRHVPVRHPAHRAGASSSSATSDLDPADNLALRPSCSRRPIALGALCGVMNERSGIVNIGIEGMMLTAAFVGFMAAMLVHEAMPSDPSPFFGVTPGARRRAARGHRGRDARVACCTHGCRSASGRTRSSAARSSTSPRSG